MDPAPEPNPGAATDPGPAPAGKRRRFTVRQEGPDQPPVPSLFRALAAPPSGPVPVPVPVLIPPGPGSYAEFVVRGSGGTGKDRDRDQNRDRDPGPTGTGPSGPLVTPGDRDQNREQNRDHDQTQNRDRDREENQDRDRNRDQNRDRDQHRDQNREQNRGHDQIQNRDRDRDRDQTQNRDRDREENQDRDRNWDQNRDRDQNQDQNRDQNQDQNRDRDQNQDQDREQNRDQPGALPALPPGSRSSSIIVSPRQRGNPVLRFIRGVPWRFGDVVPDYVLGASACALFLSLRYHQLHPEYIHERLRELGRSFGLQLLLLQVDVRDPQRSLQDLAKVCLLTDCTLLLAWSAEEAGRYLETFKSYEQKPPDLLRERVEPDFLSRVTDCLTSVRSVNRTDALSLLGTFGSLAAVAAASPQELSLCPGVGPQKAKRLFDVLHEPFLKSPR